jgi:two-component sensor histidine kinase
VRFARQSNSDASEMEPTMTAADSSIGPSIARQDFEHQNRSRNLLARVRSILSLMADTEPTASNFAAHLEGRLSALWRAEDAFFRDGANLELAILDELQTFAVNDTAVTLDGPTVRLEAKAAGVVILAVHELATNALKFGALRMPSGQIAISWSVSETEAGRRLQMRWIESGVAIMATAPRHEGFGHDLITRRIAYELGGAGEFALSPGGMTCFIEIPLPA